MSAVIVVAWMTQVIVVSALLTIAALFVQRIALHAMPARLIWSITLLTSLALMAVTPYRLATEPSEPAQLVAADTLGATTVVAPRMLWRRVLDAASGTMNDVLSAPVHAVAGAARASMRLVPAGARPIAQQFLLLTWPVSSTAMILTLIISYRRHRRELQLATRREIDGIEVAVTHSLGPAVIGVRHPQIVVPAWLLDRSRQEQSLVVTHEQAHIAAFDPALLLAACGAVALMPWNPLAWFALARLRLAIEFDCDRRVLGAGASPRQYGQLLIDLSAHSPRRAASSLALTAPAFSHHTTHLERRLITMTTRPSPHRRARRIGSALIATVALLAACESQLPTSAELQSMDVKSAESRVAKVTKLDTATALYKVDGVAVTRDAANALSADRIASIIIRGGKTQQVLIATKRPGSTNQTTATIRGVELQPTQKARVPFEGLLLVDGVRTEASALNTIKPENIESVEVVKGEAAIGLFGADAAKGAIVITTKKK